MSSKSRSNLERSSICWILVGLLDWMDIPVVVHMDNALPDEMLHKIAGSLILLCLLLNLSDLLLHSLSLAKMLLYSGKLGLLCCDIVNNLLTSTSPLASHLH